MIKKDDPDTYYRHEALHMASFISRVIYEELAENKCVRDNPEWLKLADTAGEAIANLYQAIGEVHIVDDEPTGD